MGGEIGKLGKWNIGGKVIVFENMVTKLENFKIWMEKLVAKLENYNI